MNCGSDCFTLDYDIEAGWPTFQEFVGIGKMVAEYKQDNDMV